MPRKSAEASTSANTESPGLELRSGRPLKATRKRVAVNSKPVDQTPGPRKGKPPSRTTAKKEPKSQAAKKSPHELDAGLLEAVAQCGLPDPDGEFEKLRRAHAAGADLGNLLNRASFTQALITWLKNMKYQVGLDPKDFRAEKEVNWAKHAASIGAQLFSYAGPMWISGGATSEETFPVLLPFIPLADLVAFQVKFGAPVLLLTIFADGVPVESIVQRCQQFLELGKPLPQFGLKLNGSATVCAAIYPLLVFFSESCYQATVKALLANARTKRIWDKLVLTLGFVNVPGKQVTWPELHGVEHFGAWLTKALGQKLYPFETADLINVLTLENLQQ